jgi:uncharacterized repeat protein (TIGR01451 family)
MKSKALKAIQYLLIAIMTIVISVSFVSAVAPKSFSDLSSKHWCYEKIMDFLDREFVIGYEDGTFRPDNTITRAEFVRIVNNFFGYKLTATANNTFSDVNDDAWFAKDVVEAVSRGYITGYPDGTFRPYAPIRRQEATVILARILGIDKDVYPEDHKDGLAQYTDGKQIEEWAYQAVHSYSVHNFINGYEDHSLRILQNVTRAETVELLNRLEENIVIDRESGDIKPTKKPSGGGGGSKTTPKPTATPVPDNPSLDVSKEITSTPESSDKYGLGETVTFLVTVTNNGNIALENVQIVDQLEGVVLVSGDELIKELKVGENASLVYEYTITEADIGQELKNVAVASTSGDKTTDSGEKEIPVEDLNPHMTVEKEITSTPESGDTYALGETVTFKITVTNDGNVTLTDITVTDELTSGEWTIESLAPDAVETFETSYVITEADIVAGELVNVAVANGSGDVENSGDVPVPVDEPNPHMTVEKEITSTPASGDTYALDETVAFLITVTNDGNVTLTDITVTDELTSGEWTIESLAPDAVETFETTYVITEADIVAGDLVNVAVANGSGDVENSGDVPVPVDEPEQAFTVEKSASTPASGDKFKLDEVVTYTVVVKNTGNVTLTDIVVNDVLENVVLSGDNTISELKPGESKNVIYTYTITKDDLGKKIKNVAVATASGDDTPVSGDETITVATYYTVIYQSGDHGTFAEQSYLVEEGTTTPAFSGEKTGDEGYTFVGWNEVSGEVAETVTEDATYVAQWKANDDTEYTVEFYYEESGEYLEKPSSTETRYGTTDETAEVESGDKTPTKDGYVFDEDAENVLEGTIAGDGSLVLKVYFKQQFTVTYTKGEHGTFEDEVTESLDYGDATPAYSKTTPSGEAGYTFTGWNPEVAATVTADAEYVAQWKADDDTEYKVEYYYQVSGEYKDTADSSVTRYGTTDETAEVESGDKTPTKDGYVFDEDAENVLEGTIAGDGSLVLKVYFKQQFTVTYTKGEHGTFEDEVTESLDYGDATPAYSKTTPSGEAGYTFTGWNPEVAATVTADATYEAQWSANTNTKYTVEHYKENLDGTYPDTATETENKTGTTGTDTAAVAKEYTGFKAKEFEQSTIAGDGSTVVKIYYERLSYVVTFLDFDDKFILSGDYKYETPVVDITMPDNPTREATAEFTYTFEKWTPDMVPVTEDATYKAQYTETKKKYLIKFVNEDGTELQSENLEYGETPEYKGETPTKAATAQYTYTFKEWTPEIVPVEGEATYTATYDQTLNSYLVKFVNYDDTVLQ